MPLMDNPEDLTKGSTVFDAAKAFSGVVFVHWLLFRQRAADQINPDWRALPEDRSRVRFLDKAAESWAALS